jgi:hypothetical protein
MSSGVIPKRVVTVDPVEFVTVEFVVMVDYGGERSLRCDRRKEVGDAMYGRSLVPFTNNQSANPRSRLSTL